MEWIPSAHYHLYAVGYTPQTFGITASIFKKGVCIMRLADARKLFKKYCRHYEKLYCGRAEIYTTGRDANPRFDRRIEIYLDLKTCSVEIDKVTSLLKLLDQTGTDLSR